MNEETPFAKPCNTNDDSCPPKQAKSKVSLSSVLAVMAVGFCAVGLVAGSFRHFSDEPLSANTFSLLGRSKEPKGHKTHKEHKMHNETNKTKEHTEHHGHHEHTEHHDHGHHGHKEHKEPKEPLVPPPSEQDWCMPDGKYEIFGTYRAPGNAAEEGLFLAPGRFMGTALIAQNDETAYFHLVNMTYGNPQSPHYHLPKESHEVDYYHYVFGGRTDKYDAFCTIHADKHKHSACYVPKFFPAKDVHYHKSSHSRCAKLEFPSEQGHGLCRQLATGEFNFHGTTTMGPDVQVEEWISRLTTTGPTPNDYDGTARLYMRDANPTGTLKVPLTHWLTSDDQSLESSFQVTNWENWDPKMYPEVPEGCEDAVDITKLDVRKRYFPHRGRQLYSSSGNDGDATPKAGSCPFAMMHRDLMIPALNAASNNED